MGHSNSAVTWSDAAQRAGFGRVSGAVASNGRQLTYSRLRSTSRVKDRPHRKPRPSWLSALPHHHLAVFKTNTALRRAPPVSRQNARAAITGTGLIPLYPVPRVEAI